MSSESQTGRIIPFWAFVTSKKTGRIILFNLPMDKIKQQFARYLRQSERSPLTIKNYLSDIDGFGKWFLKINGDTLTPERVTPIDLREYKRFLVEERRLKPQSTNRKLIALSCFLKWCHQAGIIEHIPEVPKRVRTVRGTSVHWLDRREQNRLLRAVQQAGSTRDIAIVKILLHTGVRVSELCALTWSDVVVTERKGKLIVRQGKGGKYREIPVNKDARRTLQCIGYAENAGTELPIFTGQRGNLTPQGVLKIIRKYAKIADLEKVSPHNLRHTFCKNLEEAGGSQVEIATLAGHESLDTTRIYTEPSFRNLKEAVERIKTES